MNSFTRFLALSFLVLIPLTSSAQTQHYNLNDDQLALEGYDPVSYFAGSKPTKGESDISFTHEAVVYYFSSEENRIKFSQSPSTYLPQYGGWCATAMAKGQKVKVEPDNFIVSDGQLFLFYKGFFGNAKSDWEKAPTKLEAKADKEWAKIKSEA